MKLLSEEIETILKEIYDFEASESVANTGTGSRREGEGFEKLLNRLWQAVYASLSQHAVSSLTFSQGNRSWNCLTKGDRTLVIPAVASVSNPISREEQRWLELVFRCTDLITSFPGQAEAELRYAPELGPFAGNKYHTQYDGLSTKFDDTILLIESGVLFQKILLEYKTAKSSKGRQLDGNAHERLSFQVMQYLEVALRYTRCKFVVMSNGAFAKYRNKYHVNFHVQADRLKNFAWFDMDHVCTPDGYRRIIETISEWLVGGGSR